MIEATNVTHNEIFNEFCIWSPTLAPKVVAYRPWGSTSIVVWLNNGFIYKIKRYGPDKFVMQAVSKDDVNKKFGLNK